MTAARRVPTTILAGIACLAALLASGAEAETPPESFEGSQWIWSEGAGADLFGLPAGCCYFRAAVNITEKSPIQSAELVVTCDNLFVVHVNGQTIGESDTDNHAWQRPKRFDLGGVLTAGHNVVAIEAVNTLPGPAGLIVKLVARLADGQEVVLASDGTWKASTVPAANWEQPDFNDQAWRRAAIVGAHGAAPWGRLSPPPAAQRAGGPVGKVRAMIGQVLEHARRAGPPPAQVVEAEPSPDFPWPEAIVFVGDDCSLYRPRGSTGTAFDSLSVTQFTVRKSRAFPEHDLPSPVKFGRKLLVLRPARPGVEPTVLVDAGRGALGSPSASFDGRWVYFTMARDGEAFFHIHRVAAEGGRVEQLTDGPFHDIDPVELPDGRIAFTSTRIGTFEEYHNPPSRALFVMDADGRNVRPLTYTFIFDNEPEVMADGRILFIRSDNFFDRGKVETLLHAIHPDGTGGYTEFGLDLGPEYGGRLRAYTCGSPAPMPDGRVAFVSNPGITIGRPGCLPKDLEHLRIESGDVAALPDGRLLTTVAGRGPVEVDYGRGSQTIEDLVYRRIAVVDLQQRPHALTTLFESSGGGLHSPIFLGPRPRPARLAPKANLERDGAPGATGFLFCHNARQTQQTTAGWEHVRAIRVLMGKGLTTRSSHSYIVHAGSEVVELGTVPLAPDGSFLVEVPADTAIAFQAVDAEGRSELNEMSWIYVRPGERRGCVGCHQPRQVAPPAEAGFPMALRARPARLLGQGDPHRFRGNNAAVTGLMELQFDRYREVAGINRHALADHPTANRADEMAALVAELSAGDSRRRATAAQRAAIFRDPRAAEALAGCLNDSSRETRLAAALALAACGTRDSIGPLLGALSDDDPLVAQAAAVALENLTGRAVPFDPFASPGSRRQQAGAWRAELMADGWDGIERELVARLASDRDPARRAAVALGHVGGDAARAALRAYVEHHRQFNPLPEWRKNHQGDAARFNALAEVNPRTIQAAVRALGALGDAQSVPMLTETLLAHADPDTGNLFLAEACAEALGRIATPQAEESLVAAFAALGDYPRYTRWYGDHDALMACHASPVHYFIIEALDAMGSTRARAILPHMIRSTPTDPDRALLLENDDYETLVGRVIRRHGAEATVVETCLAILGDAEASATPEFDAAIRATHGAWGGKPDPENRAAQVLSMVCRDRRFEPRVRAAFERYRHAETDIPRVFDTGIPVVQKLPVKHWVCFFLARTLGNLGDPNSVDALILALEQSAPEAATGRPDPLGPGVLFLHNDLTPCWRAATAWALGRIGSARATPALVSLLGDLDNALDTRHAAAEALGRIADPTGLAAMRQLAEDYPETSIRRTLRRASWPTDGPPAVAPPTTSHR